MTATLWSRVKGVVWIVFGILAVMWGFLDGVVKRDIQLPYRHYGSPRVQGPSAVLYGAGLMVGGGFLVYYGQARFRDPEGDHD